VVETAKLLEKLGHHVEETETGVDGKALANAYLTMYFGEMAADLEEMKIILGRKVTPADVEALTYTLALLGRTFSAGHFVTAMRCWDAAARQMGQFFRGYDLFLTPTTAHPPAQIGELQPSSIEKKLMAVVNMFGLGGVLKASGYRGSAGRKKSGANAVYPGGQSYRSAGHVGTPLPDHRRVALRVAFHRALRGRSPAFQAGRATGKCPALVRAKTSRMGRVNENPPHTIR
jgi:hypothetical protein